MQRKVKLYHYQLPLDCAMILRGQSVSVREGWIVELHEPCQHSQAYRVGRGEITPLPGFSRETAPQALAQLERVIKRWLARDVLALDDCCASVAFGFSMALLQLAEGAPQAEHCSNNYNNANSALLLAADLSVITSKHAQLAASSLCKLKIAAQASVAGASHDGAIKDGEVARHLLHHYPQLRLRLDANRRWSLAAALAFAEQIPTEYRQRIDFIEEPCHTPGDCLAFSRSTGIAIAWDESLRDADIHAPQQGALALIASSDSTRTLLSGSEVKAIVIKPMLTGTVSYCAKLIQLAQQQGLIAVISSSLESSFGLVQLARLAQSLTPDTTPGLDTVQIFKQQIRDAWPNCTLPLIPLSQLAVTTYE
ncbi:MAG: o-succinylbenzoate synthase [Moritella sp.]|uniref:o-succinylbenzoate synthase n=1 Tax=Moritella sp. TaxID=78556 RepID=UPI0029A98C4E|nr:o-succinylbenzoate synthase [Moritella sp.]MDX2319736.1 o-succinylbenzoate synthase [Moritella sp.]